MDVWTGFQELVSRARKPNVIITDPPAGVERRRDLEVPMADGTILRVDVYLPKPGSVGARANESRVPRQGAARPGAYPVILCAHPYGKDNLPKPADGGGYDPVPQYHVFRQPEPVRFSAWTGWEAPDPAFWCSNGFAVVNADLRGFGASDGVGDLLSEAEAADYEELIAWAADASWSNGRVGLLGVSYLALSQYRVAARNPRGLVAMCPWEGFSDVYRDFARPGGGREDGFMVMWSRMTEHAGRVSESLRDQQKARPLLDDWWRSKTPDLARITTPMLVCGSFSDHLLHSRGSHQAFQRVASTDKWLYTHRGGKWSTFYSPAAQAVQLSFLTDFVADVDTGFRKTPPVRLAVYSDRTTCDVSAVASFPPPDTVWRGVRVAAADTPAVTLDTGSSRSLVSSSWRIDTPTRIVGAPWLDLPVTVPDGGDAVIFVGLRLLRDGAEVTFEGSYGFADDLVTQGQLRVSHRALEPGLSRPNAPVAAHTSAQPATPGERVRLQIPLLPHATRLLAGDVLRLELRGTWFFATNPFDGQFPARYQSSDSTDVHLHLADAVLHLPVWPDA